MFAASLTRACAVLGITALALATPGCGRAPTAPQMPANASLSLPGLGGGSSLGSWSQFQPLAIGDTWIYADTMRIQLLTNGPQLPPTVLGSRLQVSITGTDTFAGRSYFISLEGSPDLSNPSLATALRQDRTGLYSTPDLVIIRRPSAAVTAATRALARSAEGRPAAFARAAEALSQRLRDLGSPMAARPLVTPNGTGELVFLRYPLVAGSSWTVRDQPRFARSVTGLESVVVPQGRHSAWRIEGTSEFQNARDEVTFWYSGTGMVRMHTRLFSQVLDEFGNHLGEYVVDSNRQLVSFEHSFGGIGLAARGD